jgi:hypothetical protein
MSRRSWIILVTLILLLAVGAELVVRSWRSPKGCVQIVNQGEAAIDDLVVSYAQTQVRVGKVGAGESTHVWFTAGKPGPLKLDFRQKGNPVSGFQVPDFDPIENRSAGLKLVLVVKTNLVQRSMEDDETMTPLESLVERVKDWIVADLQRTK